MDDRPLQLVVAGRITGSSERRHQGRIFHAACTVAVGRRYDDRQRGVRVAAIPFAVVGQRHLGGIEVTFFQVLVGGIKI
ncbi:hypothetical protein D3C81_1389700 [compost metagenome]